MENEGRDYIMKKPFYKRWWFIAFAIIVVLGAIGSMGEDSTKVDSVEPAEVEAEKPVEETAEEKAARETKEAEEKAEDEQKAKEKAEADAKLEAEAKAAAEKKAKEDSIPREHKSALTKAELYAKTMHLSKKGIYEQLTSDYGEGFPAEAAQYAIDTIEWDWNANALEKAKIYAETMAMSDSAIFDQLTSEYGEKFTNEEAQYAIDNL